MGQVRRDGDTLTVTSTAEWDQGDAFLQNAYHDLQDTLPAHIRPSVDSSGYRSAIEIFAEQVQSGQPSPEVMAMLHDPSARVTPLSFASVLARAAGGDVLEEDVSALVQDDFGDTQAFARAEVSRTLPVTTDLEVVFAELNAAMDDALAVLQGRLEDVKSALRRMFGLTLQA